MQPVIVLFRFLGLSSTTVKPTVASDGSPLPPGSTFDEQDTGLRWIWNGTTWLPGGATATLEQMLPQLIAIEQEILEQLKELRLETTATRLAVQERVNEGNSTQHDFRELAQTLVDNPETEEP